MKYRAKHIFEYIVLRLVTGMFRILPHKLAVLVAVNIGWLVHYVFRFRVKEARRRIKLVFKDRFSRREINSIAWKSWRNFMINIVELIRMDKFTESDLKNLYPDSTSAAETRAQMRDGKGVIISTAHLGSWDLASILLSRDDLSFFAIAASQKNPLVDKYLNKMRRSQGMDIVIRGPGTVKEVLKRLKSGQILAILPDVRVRKNGLQVPFLGGTANIAKGAALFSRQLDIPIIPAMFLREGWFRHKIHFHEPVRPDMSIEKNKDILRMTLLLLGKVENEIIRDPEQWFWYNKRWILDPVD